jgi:hypothetical protein
LFAGRRAAVEKKCCRPGRILTRWIVSHPALRARPSLSMRSMIA